MEQAHPKPNIEYTLKRLIWAIRLKQWLTEDEVNQDDGYIPSLYLPPNWNPPEASNKTEDAISKFSMTLAIELVNNTTNTGSNLTRLQYNCLQLLKDDHHFIFCLTDKNLGSVVMEHSRYFERCFTEHLNCHTTYQQLEKTETLEKVRQTCITLNNIRLQHRDSLTEAENLYFQCTAKLEYRLPQFYLTIKVHNQPWKTRPIVSSIGIYLNVFLKWLDHHFKELVIFLPTNIKDSFQVLQELKQ